MKKVLHVISGLGTGGAEMMLYKLLSSSGSFTTAVLCLGSCRETAIEKKILEQGVDIFYLNIDNKLISITCIPRLLGIIRKYSPDAVQGWMYYGNLVALFVKYFIINVPVIWNVRHSLHDLKNDKVVTRFIIKLNAFFSPCTDYIIYNSKTSAAQHENFGFSKDKSRIIPNGFDIDKPLPDQAAVSKLKSALEIDDDAKLIGCVARVHPTKGHALLLKAASLLVKEHADVRFVLVGGGADSDNEYIGRLIAESGLTGNVLLLGERNDVLDITALFDIATSASLSEAFSNTIGEAMACGVPCVVTDVGDSAWIVGDSGEVVPPESPEAMATAWLKILKMTEAERANLSRKARERIKTNFTMSLIAKQYDQLYRSVI